MTLFENTDIFPFFFSH